MAHRILRNSMEHLELYDLDKLTLPPPLPPPRKHRCHLPPGFAFERYQFLCDMTRHKADPDYAATPMFTTIKQLVPLKHRRQILGSHIPSRIVTPRSTIPPTSAEPQSARADDVTVEEGSDEDDNQNSDKDGDDNESEDQSSSSISSSSSSSSGGGGDNDNDNDDEKGIVQQIIDRNKK